MIIFPAIDIREGRVVRLTRGDYNAMTVYAEDPVETARGFQRAGAAHLHMVDLDGARDGTLSNFDVISKTAHAGGLFVQVGGGIRDLARIERYLGGGVSRVILGTGAVNDPDFLKEALRAFPGQIAVGVDARQGLVAVAGWLEVTNLDSVNFCISLRDLGVQTVVYTDIAKDGMLSGPNFEIYQRLSEISGLHVIASGGVSSVADIRRLRGMDAHGAIIGKALYTGAVDLKQAILAGEGKI